MTDVTRVRPALATLVPPRSLGAACLLVCLGLGHAWAAEPVVVELTQTACQFLEPENGIDRDFETRGKADCEATNARTASKRLAKAEVLELRPGRTVFRVTNRDVPYPLGFWLREADYDLRNPLHRLTKTSVSGGGLVTGTTQDYAVDLKAGEYLYSCPLNPTPDYRLVVRN